MRQQVPPFTKAFIHIGNSYMFVWCSSRSSSTAAAVAAARSQRALVEREAMETESTLSFHDGGGSLCLPLLEVGGLSKVPQSN